jgi:hypothetical protein
MNWRDPRAFARGWAVLLVGLVGGGFVSRAVGRGALVPGFLEFDLVHDLLHVGLLGLALYFGWFAPAPATRIYARTFGFGGLAIALLGVVPATNAMLQDLGLHLEMGEHVVHALLGIWGLAAGFSSPRAARWGPVTST